MTEIPVYPAVESGTIKARPLRQRRELADNIFRSVTRGGGIIVLTIMVMVGFFLTSNAIPAIRSQGIFKFITTEAWTPDVNVFGIAAVLTGTILVAVVALVVALPLSVGTSLFITEVAPPGLKKAMTSTIDLMAAVPSVVFGLWGFMFLQPNIIDFSRWISTWFGWIPIFAVNGTDSSNPLPNDALYTSSTFIAGLVVGLMIVPIQTSIMTESFSRAPIGEREGAYALGGTRWGVIRSVVIPYGKGGIIGGTMLGLGRALGETIAVYIIISPIFVINFHILQNGANSVAALIALRYAEANEFTMSALMAAGLALFVLTMLVNFTASTIIARSRSGAESEG